MLIFYLVFGIDEAVVDELLVVTVLTDAVDCRSGVQVLGGGDLMMMIMMVMMMMTMMMMMMMTMMMMMMMMRMMMKMKLIITRPILKLQPPDFAW